MFSSKFLQVTKSMLPSGSLITPRFKSTYQMKEPAEKCLNHFKAIEDSCVKKEGLGCRSANSSIKCVHVSPERICEKIKAPKESYREMLLSAKVRVRRPCVNECCCLADFVHKARKFKIEMDDVVRH